MAHELMEPEIPVRRLDDVPGKIMLLGLVLAAVGAVAFVAALLTDPDRAWRAYQFNWLYFTTMAAGAFMLAVVVTITKGVWSRPLRRFALSFVAFLPVAFLLMIPLLFAAGTIFPWPHEELHGPKAVWLTVPFFVARNLLAMGAFVAGALYFAYWALRPDVGPLAAEAPARLRGLYARFGRGWKGQDQEEATAAQRLGVMGPVMAGLFALAFTFVAWDFVMSLEPHWFSTLIGPYVFMAGFLSGIVATGLYTLSARRALDAEDFIRPTQLHDIGKLTFAFCVFWAYLFWAQYIVIWYGQLPQEQIFVIHRFGEPFTGLAPLVFFCIFVIPFFTLLGIAPKRTPAVYAAVAGIILLGIWIERYLLVYPSYYFEAESLPLGWQEIGVAAAFAGLLLLSLVWFAHRFPMLQRWQPYAEVELLGVPAPGSEARVD